MLCPVCGAEYGVVHTCPGAPAAALEPPPPLEFAPVRYFRQGVAIARWDHAAIQRASRDNGALLHGLLFWSVGVVLITLRDILAVVRTGRELSWLGVIVAFPLTFVVTAAWQLAYFGICHLIAKRLFNGSGTFMGIVRPMMLSSFLLWLSVIPLVGPLVAGVWWGLAILLWVFEEVERMERLKALLIVIAMNIAVSVVGMYAGFGPLARLRG